MKISVVVTAYNYARYLPAALDSVLAQACPHEVECIVVDDGSTDETPEVMRAYEGRVRYLKRENGGQGAAFNTGFEASTGDLVAMLDADDTFLPRKLSSAARAFEDDESLGLVHHALGLIGPEGGWIGRDGSPQNPPDTVPTLEHPADGDVRERLLVQGFPYIFAPCSGLVFRRSALALAMPVPARIKSDTDAMVALPVALFHKVKYLPDILGGYRVHGQNISATRKEADADPVVARAKLHLSHLEAFWENLNLALERKGVKGRLNVARSWNYMREKGKATGKTPIHFLPGAAKAVATDPLMTLSEKTKALTRLVLRSLERSWRGRP